MCSAFDTRTLWILYIIAHVDYSRCIPAELGTCGRCSHVTVQRHVLPSVLDCAWLLLLPLCDAPCFFHVYKFAPSCRRKLGMSVPCGHPHARMHAPQIGLLFFVMAFAIMSLPFKRARADEQERGR